MKALSYVSIDPNIATDTKIEAMAKALRRDRYWVAGHFPRFFGSVALHAPDGDLSSCSDELLDDWAGGVKGWGALVRRLMCDEHGVLSAWWDYNGRSLAKLKRERDRKREAADRHAGGPEDVVPAARVDVGPGLPPDLDPDRGNSSRKRRGISAEIPRNPRGSSGPNHTLPNREISVGESSPELSPRTELRVESAPARAGAARSLGVAA